MKQLSSMVSALLALALSAPAAGGQELWSDRNVLQVPYQYGAEVLKTSVYVQLPIAAVNISWVALQQRSGATGAERGLRAMLAAVYAEDPAAAARVIPQGGLAKKYPSFAAYLKAFRASLQRAGDLTVKARIDFRNVVWFLVQGAAEPDPRVFAFMRENGASEYRFDDGATNSNAAMLVLSALKHNARLGLALPAPTDLASRTSVPLERFGLPGATLFVSVKKETPAEKGAAAPGSVRKFYEDCQLALAEGRYSDYFSCFGPNVRAELRKAFDAMDPTRRASFTASALSYPDIQFTIDAGTLVVFFRSGGTTTTSALSCQNVIIRAPGSFELTSPLSSNPLDNLFRDAAFQSLALSGGAAK